MSRNHPRPGWAELPAEVRAGVELLLGEPVAEARSQEEGFSPGTADRLVLASGRRVFVKAASSEVNEHSATLHRKEARITALLPASVPAPKLLGTYDDGTWVALILADVEGRHPKLPWAADEVGAVLDVLAKLAASPAPDELDVPLLEDEFKGIFAGWDRVRDEGQLQEVAQTMGNWAVENIALLAELAKDSAAETAGNQIVHGDLRADNILLSDHGAVLIDWPWTSRGAIWTDGLAVLINVRVYDQDADVDSWLEHPLFDELAGRSVNSFLAGVAAYFAYHCLLEPPPGLPTLRAFQQRQGRAVLTWLQERLAKDC